MFIEHHSQRDPQLRRSKTLSAVCLICPSKQSNDSLSLNISSPRDETSAQ